MTKYIGFSTPISTTSLILLSSVYESFPLPAEYPELSQHVVMLPVRQEVGVLGGVGHRPGAPAVEVADVVGQHLLLVSQEVTIPITW